ncbi:hypothetical protein Gotur_012766, partial [Gossypium turneri]
IGNEFLDKVENNAAVQTWSEWNDDVKQLFYSSYGDLPYLLDIKVDKHLFRALAQFWNPAYSCFTFGGGDLVPTVEEYMALLRCSKIQADGVYSRAVNVPNFLKKVINITGMSEQWVAARIKQKGDSKFVFPKALRHVDEAVTNLFDRLDKWVTPVPAILAETFRSLNGCRRTSEGRFIRCAQLLLAWRDDILEEKWMEILRNLQEEDIEWRAHWMLPDEILYRCGNFDWVPLLGIWGAVGYAPLLKLETEKLRKRKDKAEGDLDSLKTDYKRLRCSMKAAGLGKTSEQWCQEIQEEKIKADRW